MSQAYSDPKRADDPYALPDLEVFYIDELTYRAESDRGRDGEGPEALGLPIGWYWWSCFPGCLPDGEPSGPFASEQEALDDAREGLDDPNL